MRLISAKLIITCFLGEGAKGRWPFPPLPQTPTPNPVYVKILMAVGGGANWPRPHGHLPGLGGGVGEGRGRGPWPSPTASTPSPATPSPGAYLPAGYPGRSVAFGWRRPGPSLVLPGLRPVPSMRPSISSGASFRSAAFCRRVLTIASGSAWSRFSTRPRRTREW